MDSGVGLPESDTKVQTSALKALREHIATKTPDRDWMLRMLFSLHSYGADCSIFDNSSLKTKKNKQTVEPL